ncbi:hypothetical protein [Ruminiclostridium josui]|uniref:hypothetical protein n=1 Tax=Ruminiclostridium josui TaxID=1499 RepID=UPI0004660029|nr:hypothetical protein [Ruminiclostridium josui]
MAKCNDCRYCIGTCDGEQESFGGHAYISSISYGVECKKGYSKKFKPEGETECKGFALTERLIHEKLDLINSLLPKVIDIDCDEGFCNHVLVTADDETKQVFMQCGISEDTFNRNIEASGINLNIIGFKYGKWFTSEDGYLPYKLA